MKAMRYMPAWGRSARRAVECSLTVCLAVFVTQCADTTPVWQNVHDELPGAVLSVWGPSARQVYFVGADTRDGSGPTALSFDGSSWRRISTGLNSGGLWWVWGIGADSVFMVGTGGVVLRYNPQNAAMTRMTTPGTGTLFGIWGAAANDLWAVGDNLSAAPGETRGLVWHFDGTTWQVATGLPAVAIADVALYKVWGSAANDVWVVGGGSTALHWNGVDWSSVPTGTTGVRLLTVHGSGSQRYAVGGLGSATILEPSGAGWQPVATGELPGINGVFVPETGEPVAVGSSGVVVHRSADGWHEVTNGPASGRDFHAIWMTSTSDMWCVGGLIASEPLSHGMIWHYGPRVAAGSIVGP